jgi:hypothetical protein
MIIFCSCCLCLVKLNFIRKVDYDRYASVNSYEILQLCEALSLWSINLM